MVASKWRLIGHIAAELAKVDAAQALTVAGQIEDRAGYCGALVSIAKALVGVDSERAAQVFDLAIRTAEQIGDARKRSFQLDYFVYYFRHVVDPERALKMAQGIDEAKYRCRALCMAAMGLPQADGDLLAPLAGEVASLMQQCNIASSELIIGAGLADVLTRLAQFNFDRALETTERLEEPLRGEMLGHLAQGVAAQDPERAFRMAERSVPPRHALLGAIAIELAKADLDRALQIVAKMEPAYAADNRRVNALQRMASETAKVDLNRALLIANQIARGPERCRALAAIAATLLALSGESDSDR
jgi:hypothetical protein